MEEIKLFVGGLPAELDEPHLRQKFSEFGTVTDTHVMRPGTSGQKCAFVKYGTAGEAEAAIASLHGVFKFTTDATAIIVRHADAQGRKRRTEQTPTNPYAQQPQVPAYTPYAQPQVTAYDPYAQPQVAAYDPYAQQQQVASMMPSVPVVQPQFTPDPTMGFAMQPLQDPSMAMQYAQMGAQFGAVQAATPQPKRQRSGTSESSKLFVGSLPITVTAEELIMLFSPFGALEAGNEAHVLPSKGTSGTGCAFVNFQDSGHAAIAKQVVHGKLLSFPSFYQSSGTLLVRLADNSTKPGELPPANPQATKLFVGNLPATNAEELHTLFSLFGTVEAEDGVHVLPPKGTRGNLCAFVKMASEADAAQAIAFLHEKPFPFPSFAVAAEPLLVRFADSTSGESAKPRASRWDSRQPPGGSGVPLQAAAPQIAAPALPQPTAVAPQAVPTQMDAAQAAAWQQYSMQMQQYQMQQMAAQQYPQMAQQAAFPTAFPTPAQVFAQQPAYAAAPAVAAPSVRRDIGAAGGTKLFVGNLPTGVTEAELQAFFTPYGALLAVEGVHVLPPKGTRGMVCAFVKFQAPESANAACSALNGRPAAFGSAPYHKEHLIVRSAYANKR